MNHAFVDRGKNINGAVGLYKKIINEIKKIKKAKERDITNLFDFKI